MASPSEGEAEGAVDFTVEVAVEVTVGLWAGMEFGVEIESAPPGEPTARAVSGSQKTVTIPRTVRNIKVPTTTAEVLSGVGVVDDVGLPFGVPAIGRSINTT